MTNAALSLHQAKEVTMESHKEWLKHHADTVVILGGILGSFLWMSGKFNDVDHHFNAIEQRLVRIETVLVMKGLMPNSLTTKEND
jgi:hypothetical protein